MFHRWWCYHVLAAMISKHGLPKIWWGHMLMIKKILIMSKFENTKKWSCENDECRAGSHPGYLHFWVSWYFDHVIFWESRNFGHERNRIRYDICAGRQLFGFLGDLSVGVCMCVPVNNPICPPDKSLKVNFFGSDWEPYRILHICPCLSLYEYTQFHMSAPVCPSRPPPMPPSRPPPMLPVQQNPHKTNCSAVLCSKTNKKTFNELNEF